MQILLLSHKLSIGKHFIVPISKLIRFELIPITHWYYLEMQSAFNLSLEEYIYFGGYPGAIELMHENDGQR